MANLTWYIVIAQNGTEMGAHIITNGWNVLSQLAAIKAAIPAGWTAEAYPQINSYATNG